MKEKEGRVRSACFFRWRGMRVIFSHALWLRLSSSYCLDVWEPISRGRTRCRNAYGDDIRRGKIRFGSWPRTRRRIVIAAPQTLTRFALLCRARGRCWAWTRTGCRESKRAHVKRAQRLIVGRETSLRTFRARSGFKIYFWGGGGKLLSKVGGFNVMNSILIKEQ